MKSFFVYLFVLCSPLVLLSQDLRGPQLLEKAIEYHDPNDHWTTFNDSFTVTMETPNNPDRNSRIVIDIPGEHFYMKAVRDTTAIEYRLDELDGCEVLLNGSADFSEDEAKKNGLTCERASLFKNYYTYLYGLPMKLKDPGTHIDQKVSKKTFKGKEYLVLKATYDEGVGSDVWFFYFDPTTYAMEVYQFYKGDPNGKGKDTGEYILLTEEEVVNGIKMPKTRAWYYNKDDKYLGTDILKLE